MYLEIHIFYQFVYFSSNSKLNSFCYDLSFLWDGVVGHEMMHAAGFVHEQSRSDRDDYVRLVKENLGGNFYNVNMIKANTFVRNPYDYESVLQYPLKV